MTSDDDDALGGCAHRLLARSHDVRVLRVRGYTSYVTHYSFGRVYVYVRVTTSNVCDRMRRVVRWIRQRVRERRDYRETIRDIYTTGRSRVTMRDARRSGTDKRYNDRDDERRVLRDRLGESEYGEITRARRKSEGRRPKKNRKRSRERV